MNTIKYNLVPKHQFLSGNIIEKIQKTQEAVKYDSSFSKELDTLLSVCPNEIDLESIDITPGMTWFKDTPEELCSFYEQFVAETFDEKVKFYYSPIINKWDMELKSSGKSYKNTNQYGWGFEERNSVPIPAIGTKMSNGLFTMMMDFKNPIAKEVKGHKEKQKNERFTQQAIQRQEQIRIVFIEWCKDRHGDILKDRYNNKFNNIIVSNWDNTGLFIKPFLEKAGMSKEWVDKLRPYQLDSIWRFASNQENQLLGLEVGLGKTICSIAAFVLRKQFLTAKKAIFVVQKSTLMQFSETFKDAFPNKKILTSSVEELSTGKRQMFLAYAAYWEWDAVIVTHEQFSAIPSKPENEFDYISVQIQIIQKEIEWLKEKELENSNNKKKKGKNISNKVLKGLEKQRAALEYRLNQLADKKDDGIFWEDLGFDLIVYDECQNLKRDRIITKLNVSGIPTGSSNRAEDMRLKLHQLELKYGNGYLWCSTGTPEPTNTLAGIYVFQRYLQPQLLRNNNIWHFDSWISMFGRVTTEIEFKISGLLSYTDRLREWVNLPELLKMWLCVCHLKRYQDIKNQTNVERPEEKFVIVKSKMSDYQLDYMNWLVNRYQMIQNFTPWKTYARDTDGCLLIIPEIDEEDDNRKDNGEIKEVKPIRITDKDNRPIRDPGYAASIGFIPSLVSDGYFKVYSDAKKLMLHEGLPIEQSWYETGYPEIQLLSKYSKLHKCARRIARWYRLTKDKKNNTNKLQLVFLDTGTPGGSSRICLYDTIRDMCINMGVPAEKIEYIHDAKTDEKKKELFDRANSGQIAVLMGSTKPMGIGVNIQNKIKIVHFVDICQRPDEFEQRKGRAIRPGNENKKVLIYQYITEGKPGSNYGADSCMFQLLEIKGKQRSAVLLGDPNVRRIVEETDERMAFMMLKAHSSGDKRIIRQMELSSKIEKRGYYKQTLQSEIKKLKSNGSYSINKAEEELNKKRYNLERSKKDIDITETHFNKSNNKSASKKHIIFEFKDERYIGINLKEIKIDEIKNEIKNNHVKVIFESYKIIGQIQQEYKEPVKPLGLTKIKDVFQTLIEKEVNTLKLDVLLKRTDIKEHKIGKFAGFNIMLSLTYMANSVYTKIYLGGYNQYEIKNTKTILDTIIEKVSRIRDGIEVKNEQDLFNNAQKQLEDRIKTLESKNKEYVMITEEIKRMQEEINELEMLNLGQME